MLSCRYDEEALAEVNPKKKILEKLKPDMATDASEPFFFHRRFLLSAVQDGSPSCHVCECLWGF